MIGSFKNKMIKLDIFKKINKFSDKIMVYFTWIE